VVGYQWIGSEPPPPPAAGEQASCGMMIADFVAFCFLPLSAAAAAALGHWVAHAPCLVCGAAARLASLQCI